MTKTQATNAVKAALASLNGGDHDYSPATVADLAGLPVAEVTNLIRKVGWVDMGHEHSVLGFYEMA